MRAVLTLDVVVVGDVIVLVDVVGAEGDLGAAVHAVQIQELGRVQLIPHSGHVVRGHQLDRGLAGLVQLIDGILESSRIEGLVRDVKAGVHNGDGAARAGVAKIPGFGGAGHLGSGGVFCFIRIGEVAQLDHNILNADHVADGLNGAVGNVSGNDVAGQGQVPDNVQLGAAESLCGDFAGHRLLFGQKACAVGASAGGCVARVKSGSTVQHDGYADELIVSVGGLFLFNRLVGEWEPFGNNVVVDLLKGKLDTGAAGFLGDLFRGFGSFGLVIESKAGSAQGKDHRDRQQQGQETFPGPSHASFLLLRYFI